MKDYKYDKIESTDIIFRKNPDDSYNTLYKLPDLGIENIPIIDFDWEAYEAWLALGNTPDPFWNTPDLAYDEQVLRVTNLSIEKQRGTFDYLGNTYTLQKIDKVIKDKTADKTKIFKVETVDRQFISMDKTAYKDYGDAMIDVIDSIEDQEIVHKEALKALYDGGATADQILNYDIEQGW